MRALPKFDTRFEFRFVSSEETFVRQKATVRAQSSQPSRALLYISARDGRPGRRSLRSSRGSPGDRPFPHRARQNATDTGVELDVSSGFFPTRGFAADFRLLFGLSRDAHAPSTEGLPAGFACPVLMRRSRLSRVLLWSSGYALGLQGSLRVYFRSRV